MVYILSLSILMFVLAVLFSKPAEVEKVRIPVDPNIARQKKA